MNRKEHPGGADATEDGVVVAHGRLASERHAVRRNRARQTGRDLLNVASGLPVSRLAREHDALRVAEPRASSELHDVALWQCHRRTGARRQENQLPFQLGEHPLSVWRQRAAAAGLPEGDRGGTIHASAKHRGFPAGVRAAQATEKISVLPSGDSPLAQDASSHPSRAQSLPRGLTGDVDADGVSGQQHPAVRGDVVQHEPVGRAIHGALDSGERDGMQLRARDCCAGAWR